jgi:5-hydroxyisourate hydrolase-like protein (transthyretin family)
LGFPFDVQYSVFAIRYSIRTITHKTPAEDLSSARMRQLLFFLLFASPLFSYARWDDSFLSGHVSVKPYEGSPKGIYVAMAGPYNFPDTYNSQSYFTETDSTGYYSFDHLLSGTYYIKFMPLWDKCFESDVLTDTIQIEDHDTLVHDFYVDEFASDRDWMPDYGNGTITTHVIDVNTGLPAKVNIDIFRLDVDASGIKCTTISKYQDQTDSTTGTFTTNKLCHGIYELRYYCYVDGHRDYLGQDSLYLLPDANVKLQRYVDFPGSVHPTNTLPMTDLCFHFGQHPAAELAFGVGHVIRTYQFTSIWETAQAGCEFNFSPSHFIIGPKLTYNYSGAGLLFGFITGGSLTYYTDLRNGNFFFHPQLGLTIQTVFDVYAGYNIPLGPSVINSSINKFTLTLAIEIVNRKRLEL